MKGMVQNGYVGKLSYLNFNGLKITVIEDCYNTFVIVLIFNEHVMSTATS